MALGRVNTALAAWLAQRFGPGDLTLTPISGGQSCPTFGVNWGARRMVLRKQPDGPILKGAHAVDREARVLRALRGSGVPVPAVLAYEDDPRLLGTPFYVMEHIKGRVFADYSMAGLSAEDRRAVYLDMAAVLARLHALSPDAVGLGDYGRKADYFARQLMRWTGQWRASSFGPLPELDALIGWLQAHLPKDDGRCAIVHGDFRPGNLMIHPTEPRVVAVLDWELSTLGHPLADLGFFLMGWHTTPEEYGGMRGAEAPGVPDASEIAAQYLAHAVPTAKVAPFHIAFAMFRFSVIFVGIAERARDGTAAGHNAETLAPLARAFARRGLALAEAT